MHKYTDANARAVDGWVEGGWEWGVPITHEQYVRATEGELNLLLTPMVFVPRSWYPNLSGARVLGLASGGGQQMPVFAAHGAIPTVLDYSPRQLESERMIADREGYQIDIVRADMTLRFPFEDETFDLIFHPVANCYIEDVCHVWRECYRVLKKGGVLMAGMNNDLAFLTEEADPLHIVHKMPYNPLKTLSEDEIEQRILRGEDFQFSHSLTEQIGGQLAAGLCLTDLYEDRDPPGGGGLSDYAPLYIATRAIKR